MLKHWADRVANNIDPDQMQYYAVTDLDLFCLQKQFNLINGEMVKLYVSYIVYSVYSNVFEMI